MTVPSTGHELVIDYPSGGRLRHPVTADNAASIAARLAPLVPLDVVWYITPITPRK